MDDSPRITPQMSVDHFARVRNIRLEDVGVAPVVVISWGGGVVDALAKALDGRKPEHWFYGERMLFYTAQVSGRPVSLFQAPVGAPGTVMVMEELIASGAHTFIGLGWAGSLQPSAPVGAFLIPTSGVREEGTSPHYLDPAAPVAPHPQLVTLLQQAAEAEGQPAQCGPQWTIDAPYRELVSKIAAYQTQGVLGVDMETSAMYALGQVRGVRVCNLLVVSDELWRDWRPAFHTPELLTANRRAIQVFLRLLQSESLWVQRGA